MLVAEKAVGSLCDKHMKLFLVVDNPGGSWVLFACESPAVNYVVLRPSELPDAADPTEADDVKDVEKWRKFSINLLTIVDGCVKIRAIREKRR